MFRRVVFKWDNSFSSELDLFSRYIIKNTDIPFENYFGRFNVIIITEFGYNLLKPYLKSFIIDCKKVDLYDITFCGSSRMDIIKFKESQKRTILYDRASRDGNEYSINNLHYMEYKCYATKSEITELNSHNNVEVSKLKNVIKVFGLGSNKDFLSIKNQLIKDLKFSISHIRFEGVRDIYCEMCVFIDLSKLDYLSTLDYFKILSINTVLDIK